MKLSQAKFLVVFLVGMVSETRKFKKQIMKLLTVHIARFKPFVVGTALKQRLGCDAMDCEPSVQASYRINRIKTWYLGLLRICECSRRGLPHAVR